MEKIKIYAIIVTLILLGGLGYIGFNYYKNKYYNLGVFQGQSDIIDLISKTGNIPFYSNETGQLEVKSENICTLASKVCGSGN